MAIGDANLSSVQIFEIGRKHLSSGNYKDAYSTFLRALDGSYHEFEVYEALGATALLLNDSENAELWWLKSLEKSPNRASSLVGLGTSQLTQDKIQESIENFEFALRIDPGIEGARLSLAIALLRLDRFEEAIFHAEQGVLSNNINPDFRLIRAKALVSLGRHEKAVFDLEWLHRVGAKLGEVGILECEVNRARGDFELALALAAELCETFPTRNEPLACFRGLFFDFISSASHERVADFLDSLSLPPIENGKFARLNCDITYDCKQSAKIDIIIPVHDAIEHLVKCIDSIYIARTSLLGRIIIVDDCSTSESTSWMQDLAKRSSYVLYLRTPKRFGFSNALSYGISESTTSRFVALNSDCIVGEGWLEKLSAAMNLNQKVAMVGPLSNNAGWQSVREIFDPQGNFALHYMPSDVGISETQKRLEQLKIFEAPKISLVHGFCVLVDRTIYDRLDGLDLDLFSQGYGEFQDLSMRALDAGYELQPDVQKRCCDCYLHKSA